MSAVIQIYQPDRRTYLGGSDTAAILGISPWKTAYQLWCQKVGIIPEKEDTEKAKIFARGKRLEPVVLAMMEDEGLIKVTARGQRYQDAELDYLAAEIDAESGSDNVEIKTVSHYADKDWGEPGTDDIPIYYAAQVMHGLMVTGRERCIVGALIGLDDLRVYEVRRDDDLIASIRQREIEFWRLVQEQTPPPIESAEDATFAWPQSDDSAVEATMDLVGKADELLSIKRAIKEMESREEELKGSIMAYMQEHERLTFSGKTLASWKTQTARRLDQKALAAAHPDLVEQFKIVSTSRVFRLK